MADLYSLKNDELELGTIIEMFGQRWVKASENLCLIILTRDWTNRPVLPDGCSISTLQILVIYL